MATRVLEMDFATELGRTITLRVPDALDTLTGAQAAALMDTIIARNIFTSTGGDLTGKTAAHIVVTDVTDLVLS